MGLSDDRRRLSAWETVLGPIGGRPFIESAVRAAGLTATFFLRDAMSIGGGDLNGMVGAGGDESLESTLSNLNPIASVDTLLS